MHPAQSTREKLGVFLRLFIPVLIYQLANFSATFIDNMMTGQYSQIHLAGVSTATNLWNPFFTLLTGTISALVPIIGQHLGRGNKEKIRSEFHQFLYLGILLVIALWLIIQLVAVPGLSRLGLEAEVLAVGQKYLGFIQIGIFPLVFFSICRSFFDALGLTKLSMYLMLLILPFNSFFNYVLIYGKFGFPELGGAGAGLGTSLTYFAILLVILLVMQFHPRIKEYKLWQFEAINWSMLLEDLRLGLPIGLQVFAEVAIFAVVGLFMARYSSEIIAAHQSAMNFSSLMYAFPLSISSALSIAVSYEVGAKRYEDAKEYSKLGRLVALLFALCTLTFLYFNRTIVAGLYNPDPHFIRGTSIFLTFSLFFQLADTYAAPIQGILRGYKDTTMPFLIGVAAYWLISLPFALILDRLSDLGPYAYWIGLIIGIFVCGLILNIRLSWIQKRYQ